MQNAEFRIQNEETSRARRRVFPGVAWIGFILLVFPILCFARPSDEIKTECGGRARVVWCQDAGDGTDAGAQGRNLRLIGLDTDDGRGERIILAALSNYAKPMLTPDGNKIIFSNRQEQKIYVVGFDGSGLKTLSEGFALAVWRDSLTGTDWVYAGTIVNQADAVIVNIRRFRLDKPEVSEPVWSKTPLNLDNFQLSANGQYACSTFPWPACGVAALPDREWKKFGDGCWPSLSPDNNLLLWIFDGAHRNLTIFNSKTDERWVVNINSAPGIDGFEVYHPRWGNSALFMVMTGPYKLGEGNNRIRGGGKDVEIYLGRFSKDFKKVERWVQVTRNQSADFFPDLWLASRPVVSSAGTDTKEEIKATKNAWPVLFEGIVFYWQNRAKANTFTDPVTQLSYVCRAEARGRARYGRHFEMAPSGGAFIADGGAGGLIQKCVANEQFAVEVMLTPDANPKKQLLPIIGYAAQTGIWNFLLGQQGRQLIFKLKAGNDRPDYVIALGALAGDGPIHVVISCSSSSVACYLNGEQTGYYDSIFTRYWQEGAIVFGNELKKEYAVNTEDEGTGWQGLIENVALYSRWIGPEEARKKYSAGITVMAGRKPLPVLSVKAKLISMPVIPSPASIAPYRRALAVSHYRIEETMAGICSNREVMVAQWAILDGQTLHSAQDRQVKKGEKYRLRLEQFSDHPELEGERLIMDSDRYDLPLFYDVD